MCRTYLLHDFHACESQPYTEKLHLLFTGASGVLNGENLSVCARQICQFCTKLSPKMHTDTFPAVTVCNVKSIIA